MVMLKMYEKFKTIQDIEKICMRLKTLDGCHKEIGGYFSCRGMFGKPTKEELQDLVGNKYKVK